MSRMIFSILFGVFLLSSCGQQIDYSSFEGSWKSNHIHILKQQPYTIIITKDSVDLSGEPVKVTYSKKDDVIIVKQVGSLDASWFLIVPRKAGGIEIKNLRGHEGVYTKSTSEEVESIRANPKPKRNDGVMPLY